MGIPSLLVFVSGALSEAATSEEGGKRKQLIDVSNLICWVGDWNHEKCCRGDPTTVPECWDDQFSFGECCPNADCWDGNTFTYENCCDTEQHGAGGNGGCWSGVYNYEHCCLANSVSQSWVDVFIGDVDTEQFYGVDEFYTDAQYGTDFGYYSTGKVLGKSDGKSAQEFAHYTTYPMALAPHFGRVICRLLFLMWVHLREKAPFRVVEMGAGSGQLAVDIQQCVKENVLGLSPPVWRRWNSAFEYLILERSPALAKRQRERGVRNVMGDAQTVGSCKSALRALTASTACANGAAKGEKECDAEIRRGTAEAGASAVISNELIDAFAPLKLRLSLFGEPAAVTTCQAWQEVRFVHAISEDDMLNIAAGLEHGEAQTTNLLNDLRAYSEDMFCRIANTTVGQAAQQSADVTASDIGTCLAIVFGLAELMSHADLQLPSAAHNMRLRLRKDRELSTRLRNTVAQLQRNFHNTVVIPKSVYRQLRKQLKDVPEVEVMFLAAVQTKQIPVPLSEQRCTDLKDWIEVHAERVTRLADLYRPLGYPAIQMLVRPGEQKLVELVDCLTGPTGGYMLAVDYGASFETLGHSLSVDNGDGIYIPPVPMELMAGLPDCYGEWTRCAGRVDWTTFVDFTNIAAMGERLGWNPVFYGPQSALEHISRRNVTVDGTTYNVPGYSVLAQSWASRHVQNWYGREALASKSDSAGWHQRWTSFKAVVLEKRPAGMSPGPGIISFPSWHLDEAELNPCWLLDPTSLPLADWVRRQGKEDPRAALELLTEKVNDALGRQYAMGYEEAQLSVRLVDWLVATEGCGNLRPHKARASLESTGLWLALRRRLLRTWTDVWGADDVERVARALLQRLADESTEPGEPFECLGQLAYKSLCESPGDGAPTRGPTRAQV